MNVPGPLCLPSSGVWVLRRTSTSAQDTFMILTLGLGMPGRVYITATSQVLSVHPARGQAVVFGKRPDSRVA